MMWFTVLFKIGIICSSLLTVGSSPLPRKERRQAESYLAKYGYLPEVPSNARVDYTDALPSAVREFQRMARIPQTGVLDRKTVEMMRRPRCGVKDTVVSKRLRRYSHAGLHWKSNVLSWRIVKFSQGLSQNEATDVLKYAFQVWSDVTNMYFEYKPSGYVDIEISFTQGLHQDKYPFDGPGGILAHAFFPPVNHEMEAGDIHFDDGEKWSVSLPTGREQDLLTVAIHEIGHSLGLQHSNVPNSVMWPWSDKTSRYKPVKLAYDDILGIQTLYGGKRRRSIEERNHFLCQQKADAIMLGMDDNIYYFRGHKVTILDPVTLAPSSSSTPQAISSVFTSFPDNLTVDTALTYQGPWPDAKSYLFSGPLYYRYSYDKEHGLTADDGYPKPISQGWGMQESNFNAMFLYRNKQTIYIVKDDQYWMHTGTNFGPFDTYPRLLSSRMGSKLNSMDAAFLHKNMTNYFLSNGHVYTLDHTAGKPKVDMLC